MDWVHIEAEDWVASICLRLGGALMRLNKGGVNILRPAPDDADDVLETACFPMIPYCNRIGFGRLEYNGREFIISRNFGTHPHPLHGVGWQRLWQLGEHDTGRLILELVHQGDGDWPFPFTASQIYKLTRDGLRATLHMVNSGTEPMPTGLGFHPYFVMPPDTSIQFEASRMWQTDATLLPTIPIDAGHHCNWRRGAKLNNAPFVDNAFDGWSGRAEIRRPDICIRLATDRPGWLHLFVPRTSDFFCLEPVSHGPNALANGWPMDRLGPGESMSISMTIEAEQR